MKIEKINSVLQKQALIRRLNILNKFSELQKPDKQQTIIKRLDKLYKYTKFVPTQLAEQLNCSVKDLPDKIQQYISSCPDWENKVKKPSNYMIAILKKRNVVFPANICKDIFLQLHVFGRIVGDLYIPKRTLHWSKDVFKQEYYFLEKEVLE